MKPDTCIHFTGIFKDCCKLGVNYKALTGPESGSATRLPCLTGWEPKNGPKATCDKLRLPTAEELAESEREWKAHLAKFMAVQTGKVAAWRNANKWDRRNPKGATGKVPCDACGTGEIHLSMSAYNGHVHGKCTTEGCVSWME